jgi:hypothetical protein
MDVGSLWQLPFGKLPREKDQQLSHYDIMLLGRMQHKIDR